MQAPVLVVDDDAGIRTMIREVLEDEGYPVLTAADGRAALERIVEQTPALVLLDLQMPVMSGPEVLARLRELDPPPPVVVMSAGLEARREAERLRANGYLEKPFDIELLVQMVERFGG
ncbi:MAG: response regulator [Dehalococcoidia bacterium]